MPRCGLTLLLSILAVCVGCEYRASPPRETAKNDELSETLEETKQDKHVQRLKEYADKRIERLLTKTGEGVKAIDWDLSKDNYISLVGWPEDEDSDEYIINQDIDLSIRFPAGFSVKERTTLLICKRDDATSDRLDSISFHLPNCTTDKALQIAKGYITRWKLQKYFTTDAALRALDEWHAKAKDGSAGTFLAARHDNYPIIDVEIHHSFDDSEPWFISIYFSISEPPLSTDVVACLDAIRTGDASTATKLIDGGLNPNSQNAHNESLLHQAAEYGRIDLVKYLIDKGAHVDAKGSYEQTPFWEAILHGHQDVAQLLLDRGANIDSRSHNGGTVLHYVCEYITEPVPNHKLAQWLVDHGARVDVVDNRGDTPLHKSAWKGHLAAAMLLISANADVNATNKKGMTPLDHAVNQRQTDVEQLLRKHNAQAGKSDNRT